MGALVSGGVLKCAEGAISHCSRARSGSEGALASGASHAAGFAMIGRV
jgi:hypothetical protein